MPQFRERALAASLKHKWLYAMYLVVTNSASARSRPH